MVGTPEYMAPELLAGRPYGRGVDWWTLGCLIYEMVTGRGPFNHPDMSELLRMIVNSDPIYPSYASPDCIDCIKALMKREADTRLLGGEELKKHAFYKDLDWDALAAMEIDAPWQPFGGPESPHPNTMCENRQKLKDGFGASWTGNSVRDSDGSHGSESPTTKEQVGSEPAAGGAAANPMVGKKSTNLALACELTSEGSTWRVSNPLAELLGQARGQRHLLFGLPLLDPKHASPPYIEPASLPAFTRACQAIVRELIDDGNTLKPGEQLSARTEDLLSRDVSSVRDELADNDIIMVRVAWQETPLYLHYSFRKTADTTEHSVALVPDLEAHSAITVTFTDVTKGEAAKALVRRRIEITYNEPASDEEVVSLFDKEIFSFNPAGTQAPLRENASSKSGVENYLDRRSIYARAFPDLRFQILEINAINERVLTSWCWSATHTGPYHCLVQGEYRDLPATGQRVLLHGIAVDICSDGKIVDHAAYYDHASVVRQMQPAKGETDAPALGRLSPSDSGLQPKPGEREAQELMGQLYASKVLSMLDNCCHGVGLGVCVAAEELRVAACSSDFALPLGFADKHSALGSGLIAHLRSRAVPGDDEAEETIHSICLATRERRAHRGVLVVRAPMTVGGEEDGERSLLIMAVAPMPPQPGREICYAVLLMDLSSDPGVPPELYSRERREAMKENERNRRPSRSTFAEPKAPARGYAFIPDLMKPLDDIYPCHGGGGDETHLTPAREKLAWTSDAGKKTQEELSALFLEAMHAFQCVGFCLADDNVHDLPLVWVNDGFVTLSDYTRQQLIGYNCRFLQADATDPDTVGQMKDAIVAGRGVRVTLWNMTAKREGFWNCLAIYPSHDGRYFLSVQVKLTPEFRKQIVRLKKGLPSCSSPMKSPVPHLTTPPRGSAHKPQPQSAPAALKVVDAPGTTAVARLVEIGPLVLRGATARRPGLLARVRACSTHIQRSARAV